MPKKIASPRKTYTYGKQKKDNTNKDGWKEISSTILTVKEKTNFPKKKGIWANASTVSPFKKSPLKDAKLLTVNTSLEDPFDFDSSDTDCFSFKENGVQVSPKKVQRTPSKLLNSPRSPTGVNPRLFGKTLPDESTTINVDDLKSNKGKNARKQNPKLLKKGTLAALKAELSSPTKKSPSKSPKKGSLAALKAKITSPQKKEKQLPLKSPKKGSLAALKAKLSPKKATKQQDTKSKVTNKPVTSNKKEPTKEKSPTKVISKKVRTPQKASPKKSVQKSPAKSTNRKRKNESVVEEPPVKRKVGRPKKNEVNKETEIISDASPVKRSVGRPKKNQSPSELNETTEKSKTLETKSVSPVKRKTGRGRNNVNNSIEENGDVPSIEPPPKRKAGRPKKKVVQRKGTSDNLDNTPESETMDVDNTEDVSESNQEEDSEDIFPKSGNSPSANEESIEEDAENASNENLDDVEMDEDEENEEESEDQKENGQSEEMVENGDKGEIEENDSNEEPEMSNTVADNQIEEVNKTDDTEDEGVDSVEEEELEKPVGKAKSVFSYYDKQKKNPENIFGDSKKSVVVFDEEDTEENSTEQVKSSKEEKPNSLVVKPEKKNGIEKDVEKTRSKSPTPDQNEPLEQAEREKKLVKSPFKSLKPQFRKYRRFSALPTDITMLGNSTQVVEEEELDEEDEKSSFHMTNIFGQSGSSAFKVKRDEKELFTVVRDTKHAYQCLEHGESQLFKDDLEYLLDGLKSSHNISTRCLSALELASKCMSPDFRMHMKAHGVIDSIFNVLQDAYTYELLSLCTSVIMYILSKDRQKTGFSKKIIAFVLNLLKKSSTNQTELKTSEKIHNKVKALFEKYDDSAIDCQNINSAMLARETLLSLTSQKTGEWFKEDIRILGGLDHITDSIYASSRCIQKKEENEKHYCQIERCLLLLCDITFRSGKNQEYLASYREGVLIDSLVRILTFITTKVDLTYDFGTPVQNCLFAILRFLTNLSHENEAGSVKICKQDDSLKCFLRCVLYMPQFLPENKTFDFIVVALGLLINLTEHSKQNIEILNTAFGPACYESEASSSIDDEISPVEALTHLFLVRNEASKEGDLMEELERLEKEQEEKEAELHYHDGEDALVCGDKFDDTVEETPQPTSTKEEEQAEGESSSQQTDQIQLNQKEKQDIKNTLEKAHQHMEDSHVAAYSALLIGLLAEINKDNQDTIHSLLPGGEFTPMKESLEKILAFMKMTGATNESGFTVIQRIIDFFKSCGQTYQKNTSDTVVAEA